MAECGVLGKVCATDNHMAEETFGSISSERGTRGYPRAWSLLKWVYSCPDILPRPRWATTVQSGCWRWALGRIL